MAYKWDKEKKVFVNPKKEENVMAKQKQEEEMQAEYLKKTGQNRPRNPVRERQNKTEE